MLCKALKKQTMLLRDIPLDLQDMICDFAWKRNIRQVEHCLDIVLLLKSHRLPANFYHSVVWSWIEGKFVPLPLIEFSPVDVFEQFFNLAQIRNILFQLDFRKRSVRTCGNRVNWLENMANHWSFVVQFGLFLKILKKMNGNPWCPTYQNELRNAGSRFWSGGRGGIPWSLI